MIKQALNSILAEYRDLSCLADQLFAEAATKNCKIIFHSIFSRLSVCDQNICKFRLRKWLLRRCI